MDSKRSKAAPTDEQLGELFEGIGDDKAVKKPSKPKASAKGGAHTADILAELENELGDKQPSRPNTPGNREYATKKASAMEKGSADATAPSTDRLSEEKPANVARKSGESTRSYHASFTPSATSSELQDNEKKSTVAQVQAQAQAQATSAGGGWWGGILSTASAAMKQAEAAVKEMQKNEEAKKWADQVRGNVGAVRGLGDELRHRALPTFTNILHTIAPPISSHERLLIHITHDLVGYPSLDPLIYAVFNRVMTQVEGGELLVIQRGQESTLRSPAPERPASVFFGRHSSAAGWRDGPWWRQTDSLRDLGLVEGLIDGTKLCRASAAAHASDFFDAHGGLDKARRRAVEPVSESNPVRSSDLFLSVQAVSQHSDTALFGGSSGMDKEKETSAVVEEEEDPDETVCFAVYVLDPVHEIQYATVSQAVPIQWIRWLDAPAALYPASGGGSGDESTFSEMKAIPDEIREIVEGGGVDPREWVAEWVEEVLSTAVGVVAQRYVARRMGVGISLGKGKAKVENVELEGAGEMARAGLI